MNSRAFWRRRRGIEDGFSRQARCGNWALPRRNCIANAAAPPPALGKIDWIFGVQGHAEDFVRSAVDAGHPGDRSQFFENSEEAGQFLAGFLQRGDLLLLKGSRGVKMEKILEAIDSRHARAAAKPAGQPVEASPKGRG